jgi:asparagine synthase (glutamine-hydrolysing)
MMCGILGIIDHRGIALPTVAQAMRKAGHRGPDGEGYAIWSSLTEPARCLRGRALGELPLERGALALGHRRLAILDLSDDGLQPAATADHAVWMVFNGEIYNYVELREELRHQGCVFRTATDTEVILAAFVTWGTECFRRFNGMWSLGIVDLRSRRLVLSRDRIGEKPLYYCHDGQRLAFASEIKQLVGLTSYGVHAHRPAVAQYVENGYESPGETLFAEVRPLPPGTWAEIDLDRPSAPSPVPYFRPDALYSAPLAEGEAAEALAELFADAVRLRLRSDVPVGSCLSGGLDSSAVFGQIGRTLPGRHRHAFSACYEDQRFDERPFIRDVLSRTSGIAHDEFPSVEGFLEDCDRFVYHHDEPVSSLGQYASYCVMRRARRDGIGVLLSGQGGDELFSGYWPAYYAHLYRLLRRGHWVELLGHVVGSLMPRGNPELLRRVPEHVWKFGSRRTRAHASLITKDYLRPGQARDQVWARRSLKVDEREFRLAEIREIHLPRLLRWDDRNSMAFGIETRYPFLDHRIVELALRTPVAANLHVGWNKMMLRRALGPLLPDSVRLRKTKVGFETPQAEWLRGLLGERLSAWVRASQLAIDPIVDRHRVRRLLERVRHDRVRSGLSEAQAVAFRLYMLDRWLTVFSVTP